VGRGGQSTEMHLDALDQRELVKATPRLAYLESHHIDCLFRSKSSNKNRQIQARGLVARAAC